MGSLHLNFRWLSLLVFAAVGVNVVCAQVLHPSGTRPSFAVASVRPSEPGNDLSMHNVRADSFTAQSMTVRELVAFAYGIVFDREVSGGRGLDEGERFDIAASSRMRRRLRRWASCRAMIATSRCG